jgi:hypothetical protein
MCGPSLTVSTESEQKRSNMPMGADQNKMIIQVNIPKVFSNNLKMSCKIFCCECDKSVTLSGMTKHVKTWHQMTLTTYKELYGNPRKQIIQIVYHKCAFCHQSLLFDTHDMSKHLRKKHQTSYKEYIARFMGKTQPIGPSSLVQNRVKNEAGLPVEKTSETSLVVITCDQCPRTFKQNIQLKMHSRNHSS